MSKKRVALCLSGFIGTTEKYVRGQEIDYHYGYEKYMYPSVLSYGNVDVFIHSWSKEHSHGIEDLYNPVKSKFEIDDGKRFKIRKKYYRDDEPLGSTWIRQAYSIKSMWYSRQKVIELAEEYEKESDFKYDHVILTRFDIAFMKKFEFDKYNESKLYIAAPILTQRSLSGQQVPYRINDTWFMGNTDNLVKVVKINDAYEDIAISKNKMWPLEQGSSHEIITDHFINESLFEKVECLFERPWGPSKTWVGDIRFLRADPNLKTLPEEEVNK